MTEPLSIRSLLASYRERLRPPQESVIQTALRVIEATADSTFDKRDLEYNPQARVLFVKGSGPKKSELLFHRSAILKALEEELGPGNAPKQLL